MQKQADVNSGLLLLGLLCHMLPLMFKYAVKPEAGVPIAEYTLELSRASSVVMLVAYIGYIVFQLKTHRQIFDSQEVIIFRLKYAPSLCTTYTFENLIPYFYFKEFDNDTIHELSPNFSST